MAGIPDMPGMDHTNGQLTNLHTHGFHTASRGHGDNVFTNVAPGRGFTYRYHVPKDHPPGMYWYHPHRHGFTDTQNFINGTVLPDITIHPGEVQRWRILNVGPDSIVRVGLEGQAFTVLATDGNTLHRGRARSRTS